VSNDGRVEYLSEENFRKRYVEQLTREGKTREQAESQANRIGAYFDNETKSIVLRNHNGKLSLEEAINIGALIAHERAHQLHGASESEAFRAMEKYLNRNGYALRYDPQTLQLTFIRAKNPAPLTASEIATLLQQHYPAGESEARYAASIALAPAKTDNLGVTTQPAERALLDQIEASLLKHAEPFSLKDLGQIIRSVEDNLAEVNLFPDQEQIKQLLLSLTSYSSPSGFRDFKERLNLQLNNKPWMLVRPESGTIGDVLSYLSGERVGIVEEGPLNAIPMKLLMEILATTKRPRDLAEEGGYLSNLPTDPLLAIVKQDSLPTPLMVVDKATITLLKSNPTLV
jgi:hypothetical protein